MIFQREPEGAFLLENEFSLEIPPITFSLENTYPSRKNLKQHVYQRLLENKSTSLENELPSRKNVKQHLQYICTKALWRKTRRSIKKLFYTGVNPPDCLEELEWGILLPYYSLTLLFLYSTVHLLCHVVRISEVSQLNCFL